MNRQNLTRAKILRLLRQAGVGYRELSSGSVRIYGGIDLTLIPNGTLSMTILEGHWARGVEGVEEWCNPPLTSVQQTEHLIRQLVGLK